MTLDRQVARHSRRATCLLLSAFLLLAGIGPWLASTSFESDAVGAGMGAPPPLALDVGKGAQSTVNGGAWRLDAAQPPTAGFGNLRARLWHDFAPITSPLGAPARLLLLGRLLLDGG